MTAGVGGDDILLLCLNTKTSSRDFGNQEVASDTLVVYSVEASIQFSSVVGLWSLYSILDKDLCEALAWVFPLKGCPMKFCSTPCTVGSRIVWSISKCIMRECSFKFEKNVVTRCLTRSIHYSSSYELRKTSKD